MQITINGKTVGVKFNNYACEQFVKLKGAEHSQFGFLYALVYGGIEGWKFIKENNPACNFVDPGVTFEEIVDWIDSSMNDDTVANVVKLIQEEYFRSQAYIRMNNNEEKKSELIPIPEQ